MYTQVLLRRLRVPRVWRPTRAPWPSSCRHVVTVPIGTTQLQWFVHRSALRFLPPHPISSWSETPIGCVDRSRCACTCTATLLGVVPFAVNKRMERWGRTEPSHRPRACQRTHHILCSPERAPGMAGGAAWGHAPSCLWGGVSPVKSIRRPIQEGRAENQATASVGRLATPPSAPRFRP